MFELEIKGTVYQFNFGIGFVKEVNPLAQKPVDGVPGLKEDMGLAYKIGQIISGDVVALVEVLFIANKGYEPRVSQKILEEYVDDPDTDIDKLFDDVRDFFKKANATKKMAAVIEEAMAKA